MKHLSNLDLNQNQLIQPRAHQSAGAPSTPLAGQWWYDTSTNKMMWQNNSTAIDPLARANHTGTQLAATISDFTTAATALRLDQFAAPTAAVAFGSQRITGLAAGTASTDAVNLQQLQDQVAGLSWKDEVRVATTAAGTLATSFANGQTVDAITLTTGDRILIKNQAAGAENGIYTVNASGAPTRATDSDTAAEVIGSVVLAQFGTTNAGTRWVLTNTGAITLGTTALTWAAFGGGSAYTNGNGLSLTGNVFAVVAGTGISVSTSVAVDTTTVPLKFSQLIGDGTSTSIAVTHSLGNQFAIAQVTEVSSLAVVSCDIVKTSTTVMTFNFATAPASNALRVNIIG